MGFVVGSVTDLEKVAGKDKLLKLSVDVGGGSQVTIVTNAPNVNTGSHVVVAMVGTMLSDGTEVKKATVGGCVSEGMLCDPPMLGWVGGGSGSAALVPIIHTNGERTGALAPSVVCRSARISSRQFSSDELALNISSRNAMLAVPR